ncbi:MAG: DUF6629 family protein [Bacteroidota bacterium]|nr:DUF6629 family protein [Saprospiraceae bacterium]MDZ4807987.1 DUF6629 family protein [Bacteroidota bacterium]
MCFSATASFIAGGVLSVIGVATIQKTENKQEIPFASIPLLFGIQQIIEGVIWLTFRNPAPELNGVMTFIYALFSHTLYQIFVPYSILLLETIPWRRIFLFIFLITGIAVSLYLLYFLIKFPVTSIVINNHVRYLSPHFYIYLVTGAYVVSASISALFSSHKLVNIFGALLLLSFSGVYLFQKLALISVWCIFAALMSVVIYVYFRNKNGKYPAEKDLLKEISNNLDFPLLPPVLKGV